MTPKSTQSWRPAASTAAAYEKKMLERIITTGVSCGGAVIAAGRLACQSRDRRGL
jgi:hypothetical protein